MLFSKDLWEAEDADPENPTKVASKYKLVAHVHLLQVQAMLPFLPVFPWVLPLCPPLSPLKDGNDPYEAPCPLPLRLALVEVMPGTAQEWSHDRGDFRVLNCLPLALCKC